MIAVLCLDTENLSRTSRCRKLSPRLFTNDSQVWQEIHYGNLSILMLFTKLNARATDSAFSVQFNTARVQL